MGKTKNCSGLSFPPTLPLWSSSAAEQDAPESTVAGVVMRGGTRLCPSHQLPGQPEQAWQAVTIWGERPGAAWDPQDSPGVQSYVTNPGDLRPKPEATRGSAIYRP